MSQNWKENEKKMNHENYTNRIETHNRPIMANYWSMQNIKLPIECQITCEKSGENKDNCQ